MMILLYNLRRIIQQYKSIAKTIYPKKGADCFNYRPKSSPKSRAESRAQSQSESTTESKPESKPELKEV